MRQLAQIQRGRHFSQAFYRSVYVDILRWRSSDVLVRLCHDEKQAKRNTYLDYLRHFYRIMKRNYRCEYVFKNEVIAQLCKRYAKEKQFIIINEFRVGASIVDLALFNGASIAFEIKTSYDSPRRLERQINIYKRVFDFCYIVVEGDDVGNWLNYDKGIGIIACCHGERGRLSLHEVRSASRNEIIDVDLIMQCLRVEEYERIAEQYTGELLVSPKYMHFDECTAILKNIQKDRLHRLFLETIKRRKSNMEILKKTPQELFQICLSMHLNEDQLNIITNALNTKVQ